MNRLHIKSLLSIGAVEDGDNPEADIMFWKKRSTQEPEQGLIEKEAADVKHDLSALDPDARAYVEGLEAQVAGIDESPPPLPDDLPDVVTKRLDEQSELLAKANGSRRNSQICGNSGR